MAQVFSLLDSAWLPITSSNGSRDFVRLCDLSRPDIVSVATGRPDCDISLTEFLIGLLAVTCPPKDDDDWCDGFNQAPGTEQLQQAFAPFASALVLDGCGPRFFQDRQELQGVGGSISGLLINAPGVRTLKDNADHFVKCGQTEVLSRAGAAIVLATLQTMSPSGGAGHRTSLRGGGPLTTLVVPGGPQDQSHRFWRMLWANLPVVPDDEQSPKNVFPWLVLTRVSDAAGVSTAPADVDPLQAFFGLPRRIRLVFEPNTERRPCDLLGIVDSVIVTRYVMRPWGTNYEGWSRGHRLSPYYKAKPADTVFLPVHLKSSRVGYREWLHMAIGDTDGARRSAQCVLDFRMRLSGKKGDLAVVRRDARILVAGYVMDNMKPLDFGEALLPLIVGSTPGVNTLVEELANQLVDAAQETASLVVTSVKIGLYGELAKPDLGSTVLQPIRDRFWSDSEQDFFDTLSTATDKLSELGEDALGSGRADIVVPIGAAWLIVLRRHAERIFDDNVAIDNADSRRIADIVKARWQLLVALAGYGAIGKRLFKALSLPDPAMADKKKIDKFSKASPDRMSALEKREKAAHAWWRGLTPDTAEDGKTNPGNRAALARLRRCSSVMEAAVEPATAELFKVLGLHRYDDGDLMRAAALAAVLAHVRKDGRAKIAHAIGTPRGGDANRPLLRPYSFRTLMAARSGDELLIGFRRIAALLDRTANVRNLSRVILGWTDDEPGALTRTRFAFDYHGAGDYAPLSSSEAPSSSAVKG